MRSQYGMLAAVLIVGMALGSILVPQGANGQGERFVARVPEEFSTIQAAIDAAAEGATILIGPGLYKENLKITKSLRLVGAGHKQVHVRAINEQQPTIYVEAVLPIQVYFEGFTIGDPSRSLEELPRLDPTQLSYPLMPAGIQVQGPVQAKLHKLTIGGQGGAGIFTRGVFIAEDLFTAPQLMVSEVELAHNVFGLFMMSSDSIIQRSTIRENLIGLFNVLLGKPGGLTIYRSALLGNIITGVALHNSHLPQALGHVIGNEIVGNGSGIYLGARQAGSWVEISDNQIGRNLSYGVTVMQSVCPSDFRPLLVPLMVSESATIQILGKGNELQSNGQGDLCPPDYPWPPGFRK